MRKANARKKVRRAVLNKEKRKQIKLKKQQQKFNRSNGTRK